MYSDVDFEQSNIQIYIATVPYIPNAFINNLIISDFKVSDHPDLSFKISFDVI